MVSRKADATKFIQHLNTGEAVKLAQKVEKWTVCSRSPVYPKMIIGNIAPYNILISSETNAPKSNGLFDIVISVSSTGKRVGSATVFRKHNKVEFKSLEKLLATKSISWNGLEQAQIHLSRIRMMLRT